MGVGYAGLLGAEQASHHDLESEHSPGYFHVMFADDDSTMQEFGRCLLEDMLRLEHVSYAVDAASAIELVEVNKGNGKISLAILDLRMPGNVTDPDENGDRFLVSVEEIRRIDPNCEIIVFTGTPNDISDSRIKLDDKVRVIMKVDYNVLQAAVTESRLRYEQASKDRLVRIN